MYHMRHSEPIDEVLPLVEPLSPETEKAASVYVCDYALRTGKSKEETRELLSMLGLLPGEELKSSKKKSPSQR